MSHKCCFLGLVITCLAGCESRASTEYMAPETSIPTEIPVESLMRQPITVDVVDNVLTLESASDIVYALNELKSRENNGGVYEIIRCAYRSCDEKNDSWSESTRSDALVRVNMLDVLSQAELNGAIQQLGFDARTEALSFLESPEREVIERALIVLSLRAESEDILKMEQMAIEAGDEVMFRSVLIALAFSGNEEAEPALGRIRTAVDGQRQSIVDEIINATQGMMKIR